MVDESKYGWSLEKRDTDFILSMMPTFGWLYENYFKVETSGWSNIPSGKMLMVGSHNGGLGSPDLPMMYFDWVKRYGVDRELFGLMHPAMWEALPAAAIPSEKFGAVLAHPKVAASAFERNASVLVFPGGAEDVYRPFHLWDKINFAGRRGFIKLAIKEGVPIVPFLSVGSHHTLYVLADLGPLLKQLVKMGMPWKSKFQPEVFPITWSLPWGFTAGPVPNIPMPRKIYTHIGKPIYLTEKADPEAAADKLFIEQCYQQVLTSMQDDLDKLIAKSSYK